MIFRVRSSTSQVGTLFATRVRFDRKWRILAFHISLFCYLVSSGISEQSSMQTDHPENLRFVSVVPILREGDTEENRSPASKRRSTCT